MKKIKYIQLSLLLILIFMPVFASAIEFNSLISEKSYEVNTNNDGYTDLINQDLSFSIVKINNEIANFSGEELIEGDYNHTQIPEWNSVEEKLHFLSEAIVASKNLPKPKVKYNPQNEDQPAYYDEMVKGSLEALKFIHYSLPGYNDEANYANAWYEFPEEMTIGEISFCTMIHTNVSSTGEPESRFEFSLDNIAGNSKMIKGFFNINETSINSNEFTIDAYIYPTGEESGVLAEEPILVYSSTANNFNWLQVKIFFDTFNDLYNISFQQFNTEWEFEEDESVNYQVFGNQVNQDTLERKRSGARLSPGHLLNKLDFKLFSSAYQYPSYAYIDNVTYRYYEFPAVYADVGYDNATYRIEEEGETKRWLNRSIITSYKAPLYPNTSEISLEFSGEYFNRFTKPNSINIWEQSPMWMYSLPLVVPTDNQSIVVETILDLLNDDENHLEERGILKPLVGSLYQQDSLGPFSDMEWTYDDVNSTKYTYYFNSGNTNYRLMVKYTSDSNLGMFERFKMFQGFDEREPGLIEFWVETILIVPGYSLFMILAFTTIGIYIIYNKMKNSMQNKHKI